MSDKLINIESLHSIKWTTSFNEENQHEEIRGWCIPHNDQKRALVRIPDFPPFLHLELPQYVNKKFYTWTKEKTKKFVEIINKDVIREEEFKITKSIFKTSDMLYYYKGGRKYPVILIAFRSVHAVRKATYSLNKAIVLDGYGTYFCKVHENGITNIQKFLTLANLGNCQWFDSKGVEVLEEDGEKISEGTERFPIREYIVKWKDVKAISFKDSENLISQPRICAFDIETRAPVKDKRHPNKLKSKDYAYMVTLIQYDYFSKKYENHCIIMGRCGEVNRGIVHMVKDELEFNQKFCEIINLLDPDVITGYNITGYDYGYMNMRMVRMCEKWSNASRLKISEPNVITDTLSSNAFGSQENTYVDFEGRVMTDLLTHMQRSYKFRSNTLDFVSRHFLGRTKHDITAVRMYIIYELMEESIKNPDDKDLEKRSLDEMAKVMEYCIEDSLLVIDIFIYLNMWPNLCEMSSICRISIEDVYLKGMQARIESLLYKKCADLGIILDKIPQGDVEKVGGGFVMAIPGFYVGLGIIDYASLYPSLEIEYNLSHDTLLRKENWDSVPIEKCNVIRYPQEELDISQYSEEEIEKSKKLQNSAKLSDLKNIKDARTRIIDVEYRFVKEEVKKGVLPIVLEELLEERRKVKKMMKAETDLLKKSIYNSRQLSYKVACNSVFGFSIAQKGGKAPCIPVGAATTALGRAMIKECFAISEKDYDSKSVFGDTDSFGMWFGNEHPAKEVIRKCQEMTDRINNDMFGKVLKVELEKIATALVVRHKGYAYLCMDLKTGKYIANSKKDVTTMGLISAKRELARFILDLFDDIVFNILCQKDLRSSMKIFLDGIEKIFKKEVPLDQMSFCTKYSGNFNTENAYMCVFGEEEKARGAEIFPNTRIEYIIVKEREKGDVLGKRMRLLEHYINQPEDEREEMDLGYILINKISGAFEQVFHTRYGDEIKELTDGQVYQMTNTRRKAIEAYNFITFMGEILADDHSFDECRTFIEQIFKM